jgi:myo-inositol-1(or 4)-monophosphatase
VAIALVENGEPVLGIVHNPVTGDTFSAARGSGAFRNGEPVQVREGDRLLASRSETARGEFGPFEGAWNVQAVGSIEYKLALVAAGEAAVTFSRGPKHEWDVCAGSLIVLEAGGRASELFGEPLRFNQPFPKVKGILAGAPGAYEEARTQIASVGASDRMDEFKDAPG